MESINSNEPTVIELKENVNGVFVERYPLEVPSSKSKNAFTCFKKFFDYSVSPLKRHKYSTSCVIYHVLNFAFTIALFVYVGTAVFVSLSLFSILVGIPLFYIVVETTILLAKLELVTIYYMVEDNPEILNSGVPKLGYAMGSLPPLRNFCQRLKTIVTDAQTYKILVYQILVKPFVTFFTCWPVLLVGITVYYIITPILYLSDSNAFQICYGNRICHSKNKCRCDGWGINSFGDTMPLFFSALVLYPFALRVSNVFANLTKPPAYYFLTAMYSRNNASDRQQLLEPQNQSQQV